MSKEEAEKFNYWKKIYLLLGKSFSWTTWAELKNDGFDSDKHGQPSFGVVPYLTYKDELDDTYYTFNSKFYDVLEKYNK